MTPPIAAGPAARARQRSPRPLLAALAALLLAWAPATSSRADVFFVQDGGVDEAVGCSTDDCIGTQTFELGNPDFAPIFGSVVIDSVGPTLSFDLHTGFDSVSLVEVVEGSEDNGVAEVEFSDVAYTATDLPVSQGPPGSFTIDFGATAIVDGDETQWNDANATVNGTPAFFARTEALVTGNCFVVAPGAATCSFSFGTPGFALAIGDPTPASRHFRHTMSLVVMLPEPAEWLLLASGVLGLLAIGHGRMKA